MVVEAYYDDKTNARNAQVDVNGNDGKRLIQGRTDVAGRWAFPITRLPGPGEYEAVVDAGQGHVARTRFRIEPVVFFREPLQRLRTISGVTAELAEARVPWFSLMNPGEAKPTAPISTGPTREAFTAFPWIKLAIGLGAIVVFSVTLWLVRRRR